MADPNDEDLPNHVQTVIRGIVVLLVAFSFLGAFALVQTDGLTLDTMLSIAVNLYIAVLVFYGVFYDKINSRPFRIALYAGVVFWGLSDVITGTDGTLTYVLILGGGALLTRELFLKT
ncbi:hypothetical protein [Natronocalculus amylovorans]|uniref:Uncharacterized protein n=1 Tax=Natronocalculus amylovorans TaxID=2917812 RepID=A0AAE3G0G5_9EURY|nr:hypothetical protein [Natronocalculus amylovorans]MCL9817894.1 hypothetical protein [Natronocalculus amylovorans]NUE03171.1 hypothetical protein [Halorubraceae archaeon YAN]